MNDEIYDDGMFDDDETEYVYTTDEGIEIPIDAATAAQLGQQYEQYEQAEGQQQQFEAAFLAQAERVENSIGRRLTTKEFQALAEDGVPAAQTSGQMPDLISRYKELGLDKSYTTSTEEGRRNLMEGYMAEDQAEKQAAEGVGVGTEAPAETENQSA